MSEKDIEYIRVAAYYIWENEGRPEGKSEEIWWKACEQMKNWNCGCKATKSVGKKASAKKPAVKLAVKPAIKVAAKPVAKTTAKPVVKAASIKAPVAKKTLAKSKISPLPVKSSAKIITPLYGSVKK